MYSGQINSRGPRYCPSIEDKVVRFADKDRHQLFLEPERATDRRSLRERISTSLLAMFRPVIAIDSGLERARIMRYGYAVEYDYGRRIQLRPSLESKTR